LTADDIFKPNFPLPLRYLQFAIGMILRNLPSAADRFRTKMRYARIGNRDLRHHGVAPAFANCAPKDQRIEDVDNN
jgi:hypothetical protein